MKVILVLLMSFYTLPVLAKGDAIKQPHVHEKGHSHKGKHKMNAGLKKLTAKQALISVQGMVCAFCAQGIEKNFKKRDEVKKVKVDLDKMEVLIHFTKDKQLSEEQIKEIVTGAGFLYKGLKYDQ